MEGDRKYTRRQIVVGFLPLVLIQVVLIGFEFLYPMFSEQLYLYMVYNWGYPVNELYRFVMDYGYYFLAFMLSIGVVCWGFRIKGRDLGFRGLPLDRLLKWGFLGGIGLFVLVVAIGLAIQQLVPNMEPQQIEEVLRQITNQRELIILLIITAGMAPLVEEIYFRGVVYNTFRRYLGSTWGIVLSGLFFGSMHADLVRFLPLALGGMGLALIYERSRSIYGSLLAHGVWNAIMALAVYYSLTSV